MVIINRIYRYFAYNPNEFNHARITETSQLEYRGYPSVKVYTHDRITNTDKFFAYYLDGNEELDVESMQIRFILDHVTENILDPQDNHEISFEARTATGDKIPVSNEDLIRDIPFFPTYTSNRTRRLYIVHREPDNLISMVEQSERNARFDPGFNREADESQYYTLRQLHFTLTRP